MGFAQKEGGKIAYSTWNKDLVFMNINLMNIMHEVGHQVDPFWQKDAGKHATTIFKNAIAQDTCWTTWYAQISGESEANAAFGVNGNLIEVWSEAFWLRQFQRVMNGWPNGNNMACAIKQINAAATLTDAINNGGYNPDMYSEFDGETSSRATLKADAALKATTMGLKMALKTVVSSVLPGLTSEQQPELVEYSYAETLARFDSADASSPGVVAASS